MSPLRAIRSYRTVADESAPPARFLEELLARLLADCANAQACVAAGDVGGKGQHLGHALAIVGELVAALDHRRAPELSANLAALWHYVADRLAAANLACDAKPIGEAVRVITTLREAFGQAGGGGQ